MDFPSGVIKHGKLQGISHCHFGVPEGRKIQTVMKKMYIWLVVWNMNLMTIHKISQLTNIFLTSLMRHCGILLIVAPSFWGSKVNRLNRLIAH
jgi:hypothetical protein